VSASSSARAGKLFIMPRRVQVPPQAVDRSERAVAATKTRVTAARGAVVLRERIIAG
jgi:hypothetical protein